MRIALAVRPAALAATLVAVVLAGAACQSKADRTGLASRGFYSPDFESVWDVSAREMARAGYTPDMENSSKETKTMVSRWSLSLQPFSNQGYREQATLTFHEVEDQPNRWTVEANVLREGNSNIKHPSNAVAAKWETGTRVPEKERSLVGRIELFFVPRGVSPEFRARYGMPRAPETDAPPPVTPNDEAARPR